jgi:tetratricopeptide (TPR) repeat protein
VDGREALAAAQQGETSFADAVAILRAEVAQYPFDAHRYEWLAMACVGAELFADALAAADATIALDPGCADAHWVRSSALGRAGRLEEARAAAERAVALAPADTLNWTRLVYACHEAGEATAAIAAAEELERRAPYDITPFLVRAMIFEAQESWDDCARELERGWALQRMDARWPVLLAGVRFRQGAYDPAATMAEHALELAPSEAHAAAAAQILVRARTRLSYRVPVWRRLHVWARAGIGLAAFTLASLIWSVRGAVLISLVPAVAQCAYGFVQSRRLRRAMVPAVVVRGNVAAMCMPSYAVAVGATVGATFGLAILGALLALALVGLVITGRHAREVWRRRRCDQLVLAAEVAHDRHDFATQWREAERLRRLDAHDVRTRPEYVHALAHHDIDAAMIPLDALLSRADDCEWSRDVLHCATQTVSWGLLTRGHLAGALEWARRAVAIAPERPRGQYALACAETGAFEDARIALQVPIATNNLSPATLAADLRARAIAEALLGFEHEALSTIEAARMLDGTSEEFVGAIRRVGELLDAQNDEAV